MKQNLDELKTESPPAPRIPGIRRVPRLLAPLRRRLLVAWDVERQPDYRQFLETAKNAGVKLIVYHWREFSRAHVDEAAERLEECDSASRSSTT